jgi:hypothetical protein
MNYIKIYNSLISKAQSRDIEGYTERHHIVPRCMGGSDEATNLVRLTPEEHYVAHQLLVKIYPSNRALIKAATMMIPNRPGNKMYGWLRRKLSITMSESQCGKNNSQFGMRWITNRSLQISKKIPKLDPLKQGWEEGRIINFNKIKNSDNDKKQKQIEIRELKRQEEYKDTLTHIRAYLKSDYKSLNEYCKKEYQYSLVIFTKRCKKHFSEYKQVSKQGGHDIKEKMLSIFLKYL